MLAYSLFTLSALHAVFMGFCRTQAASAGDHQEPDQPAADPDHGSAALSHDHVAFCLLTVALVSGVMFSEAIFGKAMVSTTRPCSPSPRGESSPPCWSAVASTAGAAASRCAGRWPDSWCCCWPTSAAASSPKSCSVASDSMCAPSRPFAAPLHCFPPRTGRRFRRVAQSAGWQSIVRLFPHRCH
jgi:hypothetical protein